MKCPSCNQEFKLTWQIYFKAPFGKLPCPNCHTRLIGKHRKFYWPVIILFAVIISIPIFISHNHIYGIVCWISLVLLVGLPFDRFLESRFCILEIDKMFSENKSESDDANKPNVSS